MAISIGETPAIGEVQVVWRRVAAALLDALLISAASGLISAPFTLVSRGQGVAAPTLAALLGLVVAFGYYAYMEGRFGQTLGKMALGIRVVREDTGGAPGYGAAALRTVLRVVDGLFS